MPIDQILANKTGEGITTRIVPVEHIPAGWMGLDIGPKAIRPVEREEVVAMQEQLASRLARTVALHFNVIPTTRLDPLTLPACSATVTPFPTTTPGPPGTTTPTSPGLLPPVTITRAP